MSTEAKEHSANMETEFTSLAEIDRVAQCIKSRASEHPHWNPELFDNLDASAKYVSSGCWKHLPRGVKDALYSTSMAGINGSSEMKNDAFVKVLIFLRRIIDDAFNDSGFDWNLFQATRSAYIIASDLLLNEDQTKAMLMIFCGAVFQECLAFSPQLTEGSLRTCAPMKVVETEQGKLITFEELFIMCTFIGRGIDRTRSPKAMANFLASFLANYDDTTELANRLTDLRCDYFAGPIHSFVAHGPHINSPDVGIDRIDSVRLTLLMMDTGVAVNVTDGSPSTYHEFDVHRHTPIKWLFNLCISWCNDKEQTKALLAGTHTLPLGACPRIQLAGELHYQATCGLKTLSDVGVTEDTVFVFFCDCGPHVEATAAKKTTSVKEKKQRRRKQHKSNKRATTMNAPSQLNPEILREQHSKAMEPVLDELRPRLKAIREKLASQSLVKTGPKERKSKKSSVDKENVSNSASPMLPSSAGGKAGKTVYPVLVGEPSNQPLYKTSRLCPRNRPRTITLDLHGCSRDEALKRLNKGLKVWVERAMKGEHPFITPVDIVCGGGNQILSDLVAKFIRENAQIANRPRGLA